MATNPYEEASSSRARGGGRIWLVALAVAALVTTVAWAAPLGGQRATAELSYDTHHLAPSDGRVTLTETVTFEGTQADEEYVLTATLHALGDDGSDRGAVTVGGELFEASASVVPADDGKTLSLPITLDAKGLAGRSVVCFATLSKGGEVVASWQDIQDEAQTVRFPALSASFDGIERGSELLAQKSARVKVAVSYANVVPGKGYRVTVTLVDASTRQPILDEQGKEISASLRIIPSKDGSSESVTIGFDATPHAGKRVGVRASLAMQSQTLAKCETSEAAELTIPRITSTAAPSSTSVGAAKGAMTITETVSYEGLVPGTTYVLKSTARDGDAGTMLLGGDGRQVEGAEVTCEITPSEPSGSAEVTHTLDATSLRGSSLALCDVLTRKEDGGIVATWDGLSASGHVRFASASSAAVGAHTGVACEPALERAGVRSVISYQNLEPGREYAVEGTLRRGSDDGEVGGSIADAEGNAVAARATFIPGEPDGTVELAYAFDATGLAGSRLVAQECIVRDGAEVVRVTSTQEVTIPLVEVSLSDEVTGIAETRASEDTRLVAKVSYGSLPQLDGATIVCDLLDARTGKVLLDGRGDGAGARAPIESSVDGDAEIALRADTRNLAGRSVVARARIELEGATIASTPEAWGERAVVSIPSVTATLADEASGAHVASGESTLVASVTCEGMNPSLPHSVLVTLADADTGEAVCGRDGKELVGIAAIASGEPSATMDIGIRLDGQDLAGRTLAIEEVLSCGDAVTARGGTNVDASRTVRIPRVSVDARSDVFGDGELPCDEHAKACVTVSFENLEPSLAYVLSYALADAGDGGDVEGTAGEMTIEPHKPDGTVEVPVTIDTRELAGRTLAARSSLSLDGNALADGGTADEHPLRVPAISSALHAKADGGKTVDPSANVTLVDTVSYANLTPGVEYVLEGELVDAGTGKAAMATVETGAGSGGAATSSTSSGADTATREDAFRGRPDATTVWVTDDGTYHLEGSCSLATGTLRRTTLGIARAASKVACNEESGTGAAAKEPEMSPTSASTKATERREEQRTATAAVRFTPEEASGTVDVELAINAKGLEGKRLVATQELRRGDHAVALHKDLDSETQTVAVSECGTTPNDGSSENMGQTGTGILPFAVLGVAVALAVLGAVAIAGLGKRGGSDDDER